MHRQLHILCLYQVWSFHFEYWDMIIQYFCSMDYIKYCFELLLIFSLPLALLTFGFRRILLCWVKTELVRVSVKKTTNLILLLLLRPVPRIYCMNSLFFCRCVRKPFEYVSVILLFDCGSIRSFYRSWSPQFWVISLLNIIE